MKPTFTIQLRPDGTWILDKGEVRMGEFPSQSAAEEAMKRILEPLIYHYDENGKQIGEV